jgi:hypothetical protein
MLCDIAIEEESVPTYWKIKKEAVEEIKSNKKD